MTFRHPSSQPPFGTESRCPPTITKRSESPGAVAQRLPAASLSTVTPSIPASSSRNQSLAVFHVSVQATRWAPSSSAVSRLSSRSPSTARAASTSLMSGT
jgi:hypothetical protein